MTTATRSKTAQEIYNEITAHIKSSPNGASDWYAGITQDVDQRLFGAHNVPRKGAWYIYRVCLTSNDARRVEEALINWGCDGGNGGGDSDAVYVYAYLKTAGTKR